MAKPNARLRILAYLQDHPGVSAQEISHALRVTPSNIRHHLSILIADGRAVVLGERRSVARGRPVQVYGAGERLADDPLSALASALLSKWLTGLSAEQQDSALAALADQLAALPAEGPADTATRRLAQTMERLNALHYQARWEAHAQGPHVILGHCPYGAIIVDHPELCRMDARLLGRLLAAEPVQTVKLELNARGVPFCRFVL